MVLQATLTHLGEHPLGQYIDYYKGNWSAFSARTEIQGEDFGIGSTVPVGTLFIEIDTELKAVE